MGRVVETPVHRGYSVDLTLCLDRSVDIRDGSGRMVLRKTGSEAGVWEV